MLDLKKTKKRGFNWFTILLSLILLLATGLFIYQIFSLHLLPPIWFIPLFLLVLSMDFLLVYALVIRRSKTGMRAACSVLAIALACVCGYGSFALYRSGSFLSSLTAGLNGTMNSIVNVYVLDDSGIDNLIGLDGKQVAVSNKDNSAALNTAIESIEDEGVQITLVPYDDYAQLAAALEDGTVSAAMVNMAYINQITDLDGYQNFENVTKAVYSYTYSTDVDLSSAPIADITKEPFTVMISGSDSREGLFDFDRSDVNMLVTINPQTHVVLFTGIPRDAYVPTICDQDSFACQYGEYDKLTHTGMYTYDTTKRTIENFLDVDINYTFRANFSAVVDMVDALGGIDVYVEPGYAVDYFYTNDYFGTDYGVTEGINHLNGQAALCYARERNAYLEGDFQRIRNQQEVLEQIVTKAISLNGLARYTQLLDAIQGNFWTDLTQDEIMSLLRFQIAENPDWSFISYFLNGESTSRYCAESYGFASVIILDKNSVGFAHDLIEDVLHGQSATQIQRSIDNYAYVEDFTVDYPHGTYTEGVYSDGSDGYGYQETYDYGAYDPGYSAPVYDNSDLYYDQGTYYQPESSVPESSTSPGYDASLGGSSGYEDSVAGGSYILDDYVPDPNASFTLNDF